MIRSAVLMGALASMSYESAQAQSLSSLDTDEDSVVFDLNAELRDELKSTFRLRIPNTPAHIRNAHLLDDQGREIQFRLMLDDNKEWILGTHRSDVQIELLHQIDDSTFVISARKDGQLLSLDKADLFVTDLDFGDHCIKLAPIDETELPIHIGVALDVSGSMDGHLNEVARSFRNFIAETPGSAQCKIVAFDHETGALNPATGVTWQSATYRPCKAYENFPPNGLKSRGGGTELATALRPFYTEFQDKTDGVNLMLVLSDGIGEHDKGKPIQALQRARDTALESSGVYTIVNWLGQYNTGYPLANLADQSIIGIAAGAAGKSFFEQSLGLLSSQSVLKVRSCQEDH